MKRTIIHYQQAFRNLTEKLEGNENVLAIFTYGSIVSGDIWEESNIDLFVVTSEGFPKMKDIYSEELDIPIHGKFQDKESFLNSFKLEEKRGMIRRLLLSSKLVYSKDVELTSIYNEARYMGDNQKDKFNLVFLSSLLKDLGVCQKYLKNDGVFTSYELLIRSLDSFSKLYINMYGYEVTKDALTMAMNLNDSFKDSIDKLFSHEVKAENIQYVINYINDFLDANLIPASKALLDFFEDKEGYYSSSEILNTSYFKDYNIKLENILRKLVKMGILHKECREIKLGTSNLIMETVYGFQRK